MKSIVSDKLDLIFKLQETAVNCINPEINLLSEAIHTTRKYCTCGEPLKRCFRPMHKRKGALSLVFDAIIGPSFAVSFKYNCKKSTCKNSYYHGYYFENEDKKYESLHNINQFHTSNSSFFKQNIFDDFKRFAYANGTSFELYVANFNQRFQEKFDLVKNLLNCTSFGHRDTNSLKLEVNRFIEAFKIYELQLLLERECHSLNYDFQKCP